MYSQAHRGFHWTASGGMTNVGGLGTGLDSGWTAAYGVSSDGSVVVGESWGDSGREAFRWTSSGGIVGMGFLPGGVHASGAIDVSADGSVIVGDGGYGVGEAWRWTSDGMVGLGDLAGGGFFSQASGVSGNGSVVVGVGTSASGHEAFRWTSSDGMVGLGDLPGGAFASSAISASADGSVIVGASNSASGDEAMIWDAAHGMRSLRTVLTGYGLDLTDWSLLAAYGISADGLTIAGTGFYSGLDFDVASWVARIPEPATLALLALGGLTFARRRRC